MSVLLTPEFTHFAMHMTSDIDIRLFVGVVNALLQFHNLTMDFWGDAFSARDGNQVARTQSRSSTQVTHSKAGSSWIRPSPSTRTHRCFKQHLLGCVQGLLFSVRYLMGPETAAPEDPTLDRKPDSQQLEGKETAGNTMLVLLQGWTNTESAKLGEVLQRIL